MPNVPLTSTIEHMFSGCQGERSKFDEMGVGEVVYGACAPSDGTESVRYVRAGFSDEAGEWARWLSADGMAAWHEVHSDGTESNGMARSPCATTAGAGAIVEVIVRKIRWGVGAPSDGKVDVRDPSVPAVGAGRFAKR